MADLAQMICAPSARIDDLAGELDAMGHAERLARLRTLDPKAQRRLWTLTAGRAPSLEDFVPAGTPPLVSVRHFGRNTLPAFRDFEKRFCRPSAAFLHEDVLWGYNEGATRRLVGPGYFVCRPTPTDPRGAVVIDYYMVPPEKPGAWPRVVPNDRGASRFVYAYMHDFMRRVSAQVTIGRAWRSGRETENCFVLVRES